MLSFPVITSSVVFQYIEKTIPKINKYQRLHFEPILRMYYSPFVEFLLTYHYNDHPISLLQLITYMVIQR